MTAQKYKSVDYSTAQDEYEVREVNQDRFGNVKNAILHFGDFEFGYATRRDDCYERDGSKPAYMVYDQGSISVTDVEQEKEPESIEEDIEEWFEADKKEVEYHVRQQFIGDVDWDVEDISSDEITFYDPYMLGRFTVSIKFE